MIMCKDFLKRNTFESYSEFYLMLAVAKECYRLGTHLDMTGMIIERDIAPKNMVNYFKVLVNMGAIVGEGIEKDSVKYESDLDMDTSCFTELSDKGKLFYEEEDCFLWSYEIASKLYSEFSLTMLHSMKMGNILMHLTACYLVNVYLGYLPCKPFKISITDRQKVISTYIYINLVSCSKSFKFFKDNVILDLDFADFVVDLDYSIFMNNGIMANRNKLWSISEKKEFLKKEGLVEGAICIKWERRGMCESNPIGRIIGCNLVRVEEIGNNYVTLTDIYLVKTKEELLDDYYDIPEDKRVMFKDLLDFNVNLYLENIPITSLGVKNYISTEETLFLNRLDPLELVTKKITIDGNTSQVEMTEINAIYWLLCQFEVEFDRDMYKSMYSPEEELLWDMYN